MFVQTLVVFELYYWDISCHSEDDSEHQYYKMSLFHHCIYLLTVWIRSSSNIYILEPLKTHICHNDLWPQTLTSSPLIPNGHLLQTQKVNSKPLRDINFNIKGFLRWMALWMDADRTFWLNAFDLIYNWNRDITMEWTVCFLATISQCVAPLLWTPG